MEYGLKNYAFSYYEDAAKDIPKEGKIPVEEGQTQRIGEMAYVQWERQSESGDALGNQQKAEEKISEDEQEKEGLLLRRDEKIEIKWEVEKELEAPVKSGTEVGSIQYFVGDEMYKEEKLVVKQGIEKIDYDWCLDMVIQKFQVF